MLHSTPQVFGRFIAKGAIRTAFLNRISYVSVTAIYATAIAWIYSALITRYYGYYGLGNTEPDLRILGILYGLAVFPSLWLPTALTRPSDLIIGVTYIVIFIPTLLVLPFTSNPLLGNRECLEVGGLLLVGMYLLHIVRFLPWMVVNSKKIHSGDRHQHQRTAGSADR